MKANFKFFLLLLLFSCGKEEMQKEPQIDIEGKWNLGSYESPDGDTNDQTYIIFKWYESGFEFVDKDTFYPRYYSPNKEWYTDYNNGPGKYEISNGTLTLSHDDTNLNYTFSYINENKIAISNYDASENPWTGNWILIKE